MLDSDANTAVHTEKARRDLPAPPALTILVGDSLEIDCYRACTAEGLNSKKGIGELVGVGWSKETWVHLPSQSSPSLISVKLYSLKGRMSELCVQNVGTPHVYRFKFKSIR